MNEPKPRDTKTLTLRVPKELYELIEAGAEAEQRTINNYVTWLLTQALKLAE